VRRPDGDVELADAGANFAVPPCGACGGVLKPDVVFFGESVPMAKVEAARALAEQADAALVVGTSLSTYSVFRHLKGMLARGAPLGAVNVGPTRVDEWVSFKVEAKVGEVMMRLAAEPALLLPRPV
jgi:NAD-dependent SIR2 family protein deacetylase